MTQLKNNQGIALAVVIMIMAILVSITGASLLFSSLNLKTASNLKTAGGAIYAADAGIQHALALIPNETNFTYGSGSTLVPLTPFPTSMSGYSYVVTATNNPSTSPSASTAILTSEATGPNGSKKVVEAYIGRASSSWVPPGAIYNPGPSVDLDFRIRGTVTITGNDTNVNGTPGSAATVAGIATNSDTTTQQVKNAIETPSQVTGAGGTPSVATTLYPVDINALANGFIAMAHTTTGGTIENGSLGTFNTPQITYSAGELRLRGTTSGAGVLIVDGSLRIEDTFNFQGIIIIRGGKLRIELSSSNSTGIYGSILITPSSPEIEIEGGGAIKYSSETIKKVQATWPGVLPQKARLIAWHEVMQ